MFLVIGEALVDLIGEPGSWRFEAAPGGSPRNVAVGLAAAGQPVRLASEVGDDLFGERIRDELARYGVATGDLVRTAAPTSLAFARVDEAGVAGYDFRFSWRWPGPARLDGVSCLHVGSLGALVAPGAAAVRAAVADARQRGIPVSYDPNVRPGLLGGQAAGEIEQLVAAADLVKVSSEDLAWLYSGTPERSAAARWARSGPGLVVVTRGGAGAVALHRGEVIECSAPPVTVVDTVGAGDAFTAGLLSRLAGSLAGGSVAELTGARVAEALRHAVATATAVCAHRGARPPGRAAVTALLPAARITHRGQLPVA